MNTLQKERRLTIADQKKLEKVRDIMIDIGITPEALISRLDKMGKGAKNDLNKFKAVKLLMDLSGIKKGKFVQRSEPKIIFNINKAVIPAQKKIAFNRLETNIEEE